MAVPGRNKQRIGLLVRHLVDTAVAPIGAFIAVLEARPHAFSKFRVAKTICRQYHFQAENIGESKATTVGKLAAFLGVLLAYGFVGPLGSALKHLADEEAAYFVCIKTCFIATLQGYGPDLALEYGRKTLPSVVRPSFSQLEESLRERKAAAKQAS